MIHFNTKLCGAHTVVTKNIYGTWKRHFPILKNMRHHMPLALKCIKVCAILENIFRDWGEQDPYDNIGGDPEENVPNIREGCPRVPGTEIV